MIKRTITVICLSLLAFFCLSLGACNRHSETKNNSNLNFFPIVDYNGSYDEIEYEVSVANDKNIESITIPNTYNGRKITRIKANGFKDCKNLKEINLPAGLTFVGYSAFENCESLESITIPKGIEVINSNLFGNCKNLKSITFLGKVTEIGFSAFKNCSSLTKIELPYLEKIGGDAFLGTGIIEEKSNWDNGFLYIGKTLLKGDFNLEQATVKDGTTHIDANAFNNCNNLQSITIPSTVKRIRKDAFNNCASLSTVNYGGTIQEWMSIDFYPEQRANPLSYGAELIINGELLTEISANVNPMPYVFAGYIYLEKVVLDAGQDKTYLSTGVFYNCSSLKSVTLSDSYEKIEKDCFNGCSQLSEISFSDKLKGIGSGAFYGCSSLKSITIPKACQDISTAIFNQHSGIEEISLSRHLFPKLGDMSKLKKINWLGTLEQWATHNFGSVSSSPLYYGAQLYIDGQPVTDLTISTHSVGDFAFANCQTLKSVTFNEGTERIGEWSFYQATNLEKISLGKTVVDIERNAFSYCSSLQEITVDAENKNFSVIDNVLFADEGKKLVLYPHGKTDVDYKVPNSVTEIGYGAFYGNAHLESITFSENLSIISDYAFLGNQKIKSLYFPMSVRSVGYGSFCNSKALESVVFECFYYTIGNDAFISCYALKSVSFSGGLVSLGSQSFHFCHSLESITYSGKVKNFPKSMLAWRNIIADKIICEDGYIPISS